MFGFDAGIPALLVLLGTVFIGGSLVLIAWIALILRAFRSGKWDLPIPLWLLTGAVIADGVSAGALDATPNAAPFFFALSGLWFAPMLLSSFLVLICFFRLRAKTVQSIGVLRATCVALLVINVSGFVLYVLAWPGMPLN